ncbi:MAG: GTPase HflX [Candidatus Caldatribacteriaceae bacterium]
MQTKQAGILLVIEDPKDKDSLKFVRKELVEIVESVGLDVFSVLDCRVKNPFYRYYLGKGKVQEIKEMLLRNPAICFVVFSTEITPSQQRNLEEFWRVPVHTKNALVHEIFAQRARTAQGRIKVELAKLRYQFSRLSGKGAELSRLGGGIGTRGPGEQKIEVERRKIKDRIASLRKELQRIHRQMETQRSARIKKGIPQVAIVGYTNAGKSTLFNVLTKSKTYVEKKMFATLDPTAKKGYVPEIGEVIFVDTVGFIRDMPTTIKEAFRATFEEICTADLVLLVVDISDPNHRLHLQTIREILQDMNFSDCPQIVVFNKIDLISEIPFIGNEIKGSCPHLFLSAKNRIGIEELLAQIALSLKPLMSDLSIEIEYEKLPLLEKEIYRQGYIKNIRWKNPRKIILECSIRKESLARVHSILSMTL